MEIEPKLPGQLDRRQWAELQQLQRRAMSFTVDRSSQEIDRLLYLDKNSDSAAYYDTHRYPNLLVGNRVRAGNSFHRPRVAVAAAGDRMIGFAYAAHNVSGSNALVRTSKRFTVVKDYLWLREIAVEPEFMNRGIAHKLGRVLLEDALPIQKPVTYVWPDESDNVLKPLERLGFQQTDEELIHIFGNSVEPTRQVRLQAPSVKLVLDNLIEAA